MMCDTAYDDPTVEALFLNQDAFRDPAEYERAGRGVITYLVQRGDVDYYPLLPVTTDDLWTKIKVIGAVGSAQFADLIRNYTQVPIAPNVIGVDYLNIVWLAKVLLPLVDAHGTAPERLARAPFSASCAPAVSRVISVLPKAAGRVGSDF